MEHVQRNACPLLVRSISIIRVLSVVSIWFVTPHLLTAQQDDLFKQHRILMDKAIAADRIDQVHALLKTPYVIINDPTYEASYLALAVSGSGHPAIAQLLMDKGEDPKWHNSADFTLFHYAAKNKRAVSLIPILVEGLKRNTGGVNTSEFKKVIDMQTNSQSGAPGQTALYYVVSSPTAVPPPIDDSLVKIAKLLIESANLDPNIPDATLGITALAIAKVRGYQKLTAYLEQHGAH